MDRCLIVLYCLSTVGRFKEERLIAIYLRSHKNDTNGSKVIINIFHDFCRDFVGKCESRGTSPSLNNSAARGLSPGLPDHQPPTKHNKRLNGYTNDKSPRLCECFPRFPLKRGFYVHPPGRSEFMYLLRVRRCLSILLVLGTHRLGSVHLCWLAPFQRDQLRPVLPTDFSLIPTSGMEFMRRPAQKQIEINH